MHCILVPTLCTFPLCTGCMYDARYIHEERMHRRLMGRKMWMQFFTGQAWWGEEGLGCLVPWTGVPNVSITDGAPTIGGGRSIQPFPSYSDASQTTDDTWPICISMNMNAPRSLHSIRPSANNLLPHQNKAHYFVKGNNGFYCLAFVFWF